MIHELCEDSICSDLKRTKAIACQRDSSACPLERLYLDCFLDAICKTRLYNSASHLDLIGARLGTLGY